MSGYLQLELDRSPFAAGLILLPIIGGAILTGPVAEPLDGAHQSALAPAPRLRPGRRGHHLARTTPGGPAVVVPCPAPPRRRCRHRSTREPADSAIRRDTPAGAERPAWVVSQVTYLLGIGAGIAVTSAVWEAAGADNPHGVRAALYVCAATAVVGAGLATLLKDSSERR